MHSSITFERIIDACNRPDNPGFCLACGADADGVEPDASGYECEVCGEFSVAGAEEILIFHFGG